MQSFFKFKLVFIAASGLMLSCMAVAGNNPPEVTEDGLLLLKDTKLALVYAAPGASLEGYKRIILLEPHVAFKKNWQRDTKVAGRRVSNKDMERIKQEAAELLHETFKTELDEKGGYEFVDKADDSVLILRPALIDLVITAPDIPVAGRVTQYVASAGSATLFLEMYDSVSGEILARVVDRRNMQDYGHARWANSVTNRQDAQRMFRRWAQLLRTGLDETRAEAGQPSMTPAE